MNQKERERRILVAQIGRGNYQILDYAKADEKQKGVHGTRCTYGYSFEAVYDQFRQDVKLEKEDVSEDIILLVGTATSFWGSLCAYYMDQEKALESRRYPITEQTKDAVQKQLMWKDGTCIAADELQLEEKEIYQNPTSGKPPVVIGNILIKHMEQQSYVELVERFLNRMAEQEKRPFRFKIVILEYGIHDGELQDNFGKLQDAIENILEEGESEKRVTLDKVHLCFDISMGFRSLPVYIYTFASYLTRVRPETFQLHMYYGMADGRQKEAGQPDWCPLVNLQQIDVLMQWINVVNEFRRYGSVRGLTELFETHPDWNLRITRETGEGEKQADLQQIFERFDYATNSNNLKLLEESIDDVMEIKAVLAKPEGMGVPPEARLLLQDISVDFQNRFGRFHDVSYGQSYLTIRLAEWFYEQGHIGNAAIALQEGMITYALERYPEVFGVTEEDDIFQYELRKDKTGQFAKVSHIGDSAMLAFDSIRKHIRNVNSHILREEMSDADILNNKQKLKQLIDYMVEEVKEKEGAISHKDGSRPLRQIFQQYQDVIQKRKRQEAELTRYKEKWFAAKAWDDVETYVQGTVLGDALWRKPFEEALVALNRAEPKKGMIRPDHETVQNPWIKLVYDLKQQEQEEQRKKEEERKNLEQQEKSDIAPMVRKGGEIHPGASVKIDKGKLSGKLLNFMGTHQSQVLDGFEALWEQLNLQKSECETREGDD